MLVGGWIFTEVEEFQHRNYSFSLHGPSPHHKKKNFLFTYFLEYVIVLEEHFMLLL